jgi:hypothetical protein
VTVLFDVPSREEDDAFDFRLKHLFLPLLAVWKLLLSRKSKTSKTHVLPIILNSVITIFLCRSCQQLVLLWLVVVVLRNCALRKHQATKQAVVGGSCQHIVKKQSMEK